MIDVNTNLPESTSFKQLLRTTLALKNARVHIEATSRIINTEKITSKLLFHPDNL